MVKTPATENWVQNSDYELIPGDNNFWQVRILTGPFIESVFVYDTVSFNERDLTVSFTYKLMYTPDQELDEADPEFQKTLSNILHSLMVGLLDEDANGSAANNNQERDNK